MGVFYIVNMSDILKCREKIGNSIIKTPLIKIPLLDYFTGKDIFIKTEYLQLTGSFKYRGAYNFISQIKEKKNGIIAGSSGNHALALSKICERCGINSTFCIPNDGAVNKIAKIRENGSEVIHFDRNQIERETLTKRIAEEKNLNIIPSSDHERIIQATGTIGIEILEECDDLDAILSPVGGGGLISGVSLAVHDINPAIRSIGVEPENGNDTYISLNNNKITKILTPDTIADGLRHSSPGNITFPIIQEHVESIITVKETEILKALNFTNNILNIKIEPSSAVVIAALLFHKIPKSIGKVCIVLSGSNVEDTLLNKLNMDSHLGVNINEVFN